MIDHEQNDVCKLEFTTLKDRLEKMEERQLQRDDDMKIIEKAIVAIQVANEQTARTLTKMDAKMDEVGNFKRSQFWTEDTKKAVFKYTAIVIITLVVALIGTNVIEGLQALNAIK